MAIQFLAENGEYERLRAHDPQLLSVHHDRVEGIIDQTVYGIYEPRETEVLIDVAEAMDTIAESGAEARSAKGRHLAQVAADVYGSREKFYVTRLRRLLSFPNKINSKLNNGAVVDVDDDGIVYKTSLHGDFERLAAAEGSRTVKNVKRAVDGNIARFNDVVALLERKQPALKSAVETIREDTYAVVSAQVPSSLKALAPAKPKR